MDCPDEQDVMPVLKACLRRVKGKRAAEQVDWSGAMRLECGPFRGGHRNDSRRVPGQLHNGLLLR